MALKLRIGSPVGGDDFFGRSVELAKAEALIEHNNLMLAAPRRVGKTSFAKKLLEIQKEKGWNTIFIDLEEITSINHFFKAFHDELMKLPEASLTDKITNKLKKWVSNAEFSTSGIPVKATIKISDQGAEDFGILADVLNELEHHTIVVFDELTVLLESLLGKDNDEQTVRTFLNMFRALRSATTTKCSWLVCSSIGVRNFTTERKLSDTINDIADFELGAYTDTEGIEFVRLLANSIGLDIDIKCTRYILNKIGWNIPFFIQLILSRLTIGKVTKKDIDTAYEGLLQTGSFDTWNERLDKEYGKNKSTSKLILQYLCVHVDGKMRDEIINYIHAAYPEMDSYEFGLLMRTLITDGYLVNDSGRYKFRSPLLRDYWKVTYC